MFAVFLFLSSSLCVLGAFPLCELYQDRFGKWVNTLEASCASTYQDINDHFLFGGPRESTEFSKIWLPSDCAVHRFSAKTIHTVVDHIVSKTKRKPFHISVISDSGLRGILCGIMRILSGSELTGPLQSDICGHNKRPVAISLDQLNIQHFDQFGSNITFSFTYVQSLTNPGTIAHMKAVIAQKPNVLVLNTGAWDFDKYNRAHPNEFATDECSNPEFEASSLLRASDAVKAGLLDAAQLGKEHQVRLIYRSTHVNKWFGPTCGDARVIKLMDGTRWEVWDNALMSKDVWRTQCRDGFHFDRAFTHTEEAHMELPLLTQRRLTWSC